MSTLFAGPRGQVTPRLRAYYARRAEGGVGLVTVEEASIHPLLPHVASALGAHGDGLIPGLASLAEAIHPGGAAASIQLGIYFRQAVNGFPRFAASADAPDAGPLSELTPAELPPGGLFARRERCAGGFEG